MKLKTLTEYSKEQISWHDFEKVLRTKEKLIRILIASLNSQYAKPLNELLGLITKLFNHKLDEKFAEEHEIKLEDLKQIKTFHWVFEFPEVFLDRGGFDVVVGNPPYITFSKVSGSKRITKKIDLLTKEFIRKFYNSAEYKISTYSTFIEKGVEVLHNQAYFGYIIPDTLLIGRYFSKIRKYTLCNTKICYIILFLKDFWKVGTVGLPTIIVLQKESDNVLRDKNTVKLILADDLSSFKNSNCTIINTKQNYYLEMEYNRFRIYNSYTVKEIIDHFFKIKKKIGKYLDFNVGIRTKASKKDIISNESKGKQWKPCIVHGDTINRYSIKIEDIQYVNLDPNILWSGGWSPDVVFRRKILIRKTGNYIIATLDVQGLYHLDIITSAVRKNKRYYLNFLLTILNSKPVNFFFNCAFHLFNRTLAQINSESLERIPIPDLEKNKQSYFIHLSNYLLFLNATEERRQKLKEAIEFFDRQIADSLVYELYFKEKFAEDGLYPEPKEYLLEVVSKHLKPINYDRWAELYWKKQIEGNLTEEEQKELEKLEKENIKTIEEVYKALKEDVKTRELIEKIKSHEWVKVIEDEG